MHHQAVMPMMRHPLMTHALPSGGLACALPVAKAASWLMLAHQLVIPHDQLIMHPALAQQFRHTSEPAR